MNHLKHCIGGFAIGTPLAVVFYTKVGGVSEISGRSMRPTLNPEDNRSRDKVWVSRWGMHRYRPQPGDVVTAISPNDPTKRIVKRVLALQGAIIWRRQSSRSYNKMAQQQTVGYVRVPKGHCWIEGDNERSSQDSNTFGPVSLGLIYGRVTHIIWPPGRWCVLDTRLLPHQQDRVVSDSEDSLQLDHNDLEILNELHRNQGNDDD